MVQSRRGLVICEVLVALLVLAAVVAVLLVAGDKQRRLMGLGGSIANLRQLSVLHSSYSADNGSRIATFTWNATTAGQTAYPDLEGPYSQDVAAGAAQAVDILRRLTGQTAAEIPPMLDWTPHMSYSHLVLADSMKLPTPMPWVVSPGDAPRLKWRQANQGPKPDDPSSIRWVHSSSYEMPLAFWCNDFGDDAGTIPTLNQGSNYNNYITVGGLSGILGKRRVDEVAYPSSKVMLFEQFQRFFGPREAIAFYPEARVPALMSDGSAAARSTAQANRGQIQTRPRSSFTTSKFSYAPAAWDPPPLYGGAETLEGYFRLTRYGLRGRDFDGPETTTPP